MITSETKKKNKLLGRETVVKCHEPSNQGLNPGQAAVVMVTGPAVEHHFFLSLWDALHPTVSSPPDVLSVLIFNKSININRHKSKMMLATLVLSCYKM